MINKKTIIKLPHQVTACITDEYPLCSNFL